MLVARAFLAFFRARVVRFGLWLFLALLGAVQLYLWGGCVSDARKYPFRVKKGYLVVECRVMLWWLGFHRWIPRTPCPQAITPNHLEDHIY